MLETDSESRSEGWQPGEEAVTTPEERQNCAVAWRAGISQESCEDMLCSLSNKEGRETCEDSITDFHLK